MDSNSSGARESKTDEEDGGDGTARAGTGGADGRGGRERAGESGGARYGGEELERQGSNHRTKRRYWPLEMEILWRSCQSFALADQCVPNSHIQETVEHIRVLCSKYEERNGEPFFLPFVDDTIVRGQKGVVRANESTISFIPSQTLEEEARPDAERELTLDEAVDVCLEEVSETLLNTAIFFETCTTGHGAPGLQTKAVSYRRLADKGDHKTRGAKPSVSSSKAKPLAGSAMRQALSHSLRFNQVLVEGIRVIIHWLPRGETRIRRVHRVMFLEQEDQLLKFYRVIDEHMVDEDEHVIVRNITHICIEARTKIFRESLTHLNGRPESSDALTQSQRCFSIFGGASPFDGSDVINVEIQPINRHLREELKAAHRIAVGISVALQLVADTQRDHRVGDLEHLPRDLPGPRAEHGDARRMYRHMLANDCTATFISEVPGYAELILQRERRQAQLTSANRDALAELEDEEDGGDDDSDDHENDTDNDDHDDDNLIGGSAHDRQLSHNDGVPGSLGGHAAATGRAPADNGNRLPSSSILPSGSRMGPSAHL